MDISKSHLSKKVPIDFLKCGAFRRLLFCFSYHIRFPVGIFANFNLLITCESYPHLEEEDRCMEKLDPGPCQYYQVKWFWDAKYERCNEFHYGGCLGTRNRFNTKQECVKQCIFKEHNPASIPDLCLLGADSGHCGDERHGQWWYFFNAVNGVCEQFFFYGCGGNHNKFYSLYQCRKVCGERLSPQIGGQLSKKI